MHKAEIHSCTDLPCDLSVHLACTKTWFNIVTDLSSVACCEKSTVCTWFLNVWVKIGALLVTKRWYNVNHPLWSQTAWVQILALPLIGCIKLGNLNNFCKPVSLPTENEDNSTKHITLWWGLNDIMLMKEHMVSAQKLLVMKNYFLFKAKEAIWIYSRSTLIEGNSLQIYFSLVLKPKIFQNVNLQSF